MPKPFNELLTYILGNNEKILANLLILRCNQVTPTKKSLKKKPGVNYHNLLACEKPRHCLPQGPQRPETRSFLSGDPPLFPLQVSVANAQSGLHIPPSRTLPSCSRDVFHTCRFPGPYSPPTLEEIGQWILLTAVDILTSTLYASSFTLSVGFSACYNSDLPT